jgi:hypothetical protein
VSLVFEKARAEFSLPETEVAEQAYRFAEQIEPAFVFAHSVRSYLYARELTGQGPFQDYGEELLSSRPSYLLECSTN